MIKDNSVMDELKEIMECDDKFGDEGLCYNTDVSDGSSYEGFINFTDGFVDVKAYYYVRNNELTFKKEGSEGQKERAENAQKILDNLMEPDYSSFYKDYILGSEWESEFDSLDAFIDWYNNYNPYEKDPTPSLFEEGLHYDLDPKHDKLWDKFNDYDMDYYENTPAFIGVALKLYDNDNSRNDLNNGKHLARLESYLNDDLGYGRDRVGGWARQLGMVSADGSDIGNHVIYLNEFAYDTVDELKEKLKVYVNDAYKSLGLVW